MSYFKSHNIGTGFENSGDPASQLKAKRSFRIGLACKKSETMMGYASFTKGRNPTGWFQIGFCDDVTPGQVKPLKYFNKDLVLWRGRSGKLFLQDAHCLHLGAHRGHTGHIKDTVKGDNLICPWHLWEWNGDGHLVDIPYSPGECKKNIKIRSYPVIEWCDQIMCWYDPEGAEPSWSLPAVWQYGHPEWYSFKPSRLLNRIKCHPQMPQENTVDFAHIYPIHGPGGFPVCDEISVDGTHFRSLVTLEYGGGKTSTYITPDGPMKAQIDMNSYGIGVSIVYWHEKPWPSVEITGFTPVDDEYTDYYFVMASKRGEGETGDEPQGRAKAMLRVQHTVIPQDFFIWENMKYNENANYSRAESKLYPVFREWAQQFYPDTRPGWEERQKTRRQA